MGGGHAGRIGLCSLGIAMEDACIFCRIASHRAPASIVCEDDRTVAFMDLYPVNPGHVLVIPREHAESLADLDAAVGGEVFKTAMRIASALRERAIKCDGVNLILADGQAAGQEIPHVHLHVIPRYRGDDFSMSSRHRSRPTMDDLGRIAEEISSKLRWPPA